MGGRQRGASRRDAKGLRPASVPLLLSASIPVVPPFIKKSAPEYPARVNRMVRLHRTSFSITGR